MMPTSEPSLHGEAHVVEQRGLADLHGEVVGEERRGSGVDELVQVLAVEDEVVAADRNAVALRSAGRG